MRAISMLVATALGIAASATAQVATQQRPNPNPLSTTASVRVIRDITYEEIDGKQLGLDLFRPSTGAGLRPAVVFINNGGFVRSIKAAFAPQATRMAELGFVSASIEIRTAPESHFPAQLNDVEASVRWIHEHAAEFQIDTNRIGVVGISSGGYIAAAIGTNLWSGHDWSGTPRNLRVQAIVAFNPNSDLPALADLVATGRNTAPIPVT